MGRKKEDNQSWVTHVGYCSVVVFLVWQGCYLNWYLSAEGRSWVTHVGSIGISLLILASLFFSLCWFLGWAYRPYGRTG